MEKDKQSQDTLGTNLGNKDTPADAKPSKKNIKKHIKRYKRKDKIKEKISSVTSANSNVFVFDEIADNKEASALVADLVKCYTCNVNLPDNELKLLNKTLQERTISVFLDILNHCAEKIFNKLLNMEFFKSLIYKKKVLKKDAYCQTDK